MGALLAGCFRTKCDHFSLFKLSLKWNGRYTFDTTGYRLVSFLWRFWNVLLYFFKKKPLHFVWKRILWTIQYIKKKNQEESLSCMWAWFWRLYPYKKMGNFSLLSYKKQNVCSSYLKPCSHRASALTWALTRFNLSRTHLNFDNSVDNWCEWCNWNQGIPFKRQR